MNLRDITKQFLRTPVYDGYTQALLFKGKTGAHDDHASSGATSRRRTLVLPPTATLPARGAVKIVEDVWLTGSANYDAFQGHNRRLNTDLRKANVLLEKLTPAEACLNLAGPSMFGRRDYYKDINDAATGTEYDTLWHLFTVRMEGVAKGHFLRVDGRLMHVRVAYPVEELLTLSEADQLDDDALQPVKFTGLGKIDLATGTLRTEDIHTWAIQTDMQKFFMYPTQASKQPQPGDRTVFVAMSAVTPGTGAVLEMLGQSWRVVTATPHLDAWALQVRLG